MNTFKHILLLLAISLHFSLNGMAEEINTEPVTATESKPMVEDSMGNVQPTIDDGEVSTVMQGSEPTDTGSESGSSPAAHNLARAQLTTDVVNREPVDEVVSVPQDIGQLFFFTELRDMKGQTITHRWEHNGKILAEVNFTIGGNRWRVYSQKTIKPEWIGPWTVTVLDDHANELTKQAFTVEATARPAE